MLYSTYYHEHEVFLDSLNRYLAAELIPKVDHWEKTGHFPDQLFKDLGQQGYLGILISEDYGGIGGDYSLAAAWCEAFGEVPAVGLTTGVNMHSLIVSHALQEFGSTLACQTWLPRAVAGDAIGAYAFTEPGAGSDLSSITTKAEKKGAKWILNGAKTFITNGARADFILVLARNDFAAGYNGFSTFVVDTNSPGFSVTRTLDKLGWRSSDTAEMILENVEVSEDSVLGKIGEGWQQASRNLNWERLVLLLTSLGGARACLKDTLRYAGERKVKGRYLYEYGALSAALQEMYHRLARSEAISRAAFRAVESGRHSRAEVSLAKRMVCEDAVWIADKAIQIHGGYGYTTEFSPERWWRDLRLMTIGGGTSEVMANIVRKELAW
jgi:acyl-CoA dehydrogenase